MYYYTDKGTPFVTAGTSKRTIEHKTYQS